MAKKFIKTGFKFLKKNDLEVKNFIAYIKSNEEEASDNIIDKSGHSQQDEQAGQKKEESKEKEV